MKKIVYVLFLVLVCITHAHATHERSGEITYKHISGNTYKITITTYTKESSEAADRCKLTVFFGDGDSANFQRNNGSTIGLSNNEPCPYYGESLGNDIKKNTYEGIHTYSGPGNYIITMNDDNRNVNIVNIPNSVNKSFSLRTELKISPILIPANNSPELLNPPIDDACIGRCFYHNPEAYDIDGDSLSYSIVSCYADGVPIIGWTLPDNMTIDVKRGTVSWCNPTTTGLYNIAILIKEWRRLPGDPSRYFIGSVLRDLQIEVKNCINNPPVVKANDTCIVAGNNLNSLVSATDPDIGETITLTSTGGPFQIIPMATFSSVPSFSPVTGIFNWSPSCKQIQLLPFSILYKAVDNNFDPLAGYKSVFITVIAPAPTSLTATPSGTSIILDWNDAFCNDTLGNNPFTGYTIYRKSSCDSWKPPVCQTGVPSSSGYTKIGSTLPSVTTFTDNENGQGLTYGIDYSYIIVANYTDGAQSYASTAVCGKLVRDVPIITNVSVLSTGTNDKIWIHWIPPVANSTNLDTVANPPIYEVRLFQAQGASPAANSFTEVVKYTYSSFAQMTDTGYVSTGLNTKDSTYSYRVDFYSNGVFIGSSNVASSVYLTSTPDDKKITLSWQETVPWNNYKYYIYKETSPNSAVFNLIDSTSNTSYTDTGLVNRITYCYKIVSVGKFSDTTIIYPLLNNSQISCVAPVDKIPPCQPKITSINGNCETEQTTFTWLNPNTYCSNDALKYNIYFATTDVGTLLFYDSVTNINTTTYVLQYLYEGKTPSVAGCYAVTAIDSSGNESPIVTKECTDNCPIYDLPNVFTPNDDGINDLYKPLIPYRYIKDIDIKIYNRWGTKLFETTNPDILWDGKNMANKKPCPDGVYYYICTVNEIRLSGIVPHVLKGFIHLLSQNKN